MTRPKPTIIDHLQRVTLRMEAGRTPEEMDLTPVPAVVDFIFGIGSRGLSPFEFELAGRSTGDEVLFTVGKGERAALLEHLVSLLSGFPETFETFFLKAGIIDVRRAESHEIVKAMANLAGCGGGCGDGCCGPHP